MEYAAKGTLISWDNSALKFIPNVTGLSENYLRIIFRDCIKGLHYSTKNNINILAYLCLKFHY